MSAGCVMPVRALRAGRALAQDSAERPARVAAHACLMRCASRALMASCAYMCATWLAERDAPQRCCRAFAYLARGDSREQGATLMCCASRVTGLALQWNCTVLLSGCWQLDGCAPRRAAVLRAGGTVYRRRLAPRARASGQTVALCSL